MLKQITEMIEQVASGMDCYKGKMSQENVIHILKSLAYDANQAETELNRLREEVKQLQYKSDTMEYERDQLEVEVERLKMSTITVSVWEEGLMDVGFTIQSINNLRLDEVNEVVDSLIDDFDFLLEHRECNVVLKPNYNKAQIGDYPPPNIESKAYWDFEIVEVIPFENGEQKEGDKIE